MAQPQNRDLTLWSNISQHGVPEIVIGAGNGQQRVALAPPDRQQDSYWVTVFDRSNVQQPVVNQVQPARDNGTIPSGLSQYADNPKYFFVFITNYLNTLHVPQGELYAFLLTNGAGLPLKRLEQINTTMGCGAFGRMSYTLTNIFQDTDNQGFDASSIFQDTVMTLTLLAVERDGTIWYEPSRVVV